MMTHLGWETRRMTHQISVTADWVPFWVVSHPYDLQSDQSADQTWFGFAMQR